MNSPLFTILASIVLFQFVLISFFLFTVKKGRKLSNRLLGLFLLLLAINIGDGLLTYYRFFVEFPALALVEDCFILLYGPIILVYTKSVIYKDFRLSTRAVWHGTPFLVLAILSLVGYHLQPEQFQQQIQNAILQHELPASFYWAVVIIYLQLFSYLFLAWQDVHRYRQKLKDLVSSVHRINLEWLSFMIYSFGFLLLLSLANRLMTITLWKGFFDEVMMVIFVFLFSFINAIVLRGLRHPEIFAGIGEAELAKKYRGSTLTSREREELQARLTNLMQNEKPFLNPEITLDDLSDKLSVPSKKLSQLLNETYRQNYFDFINSHRIEEARKIMTDSKDPKLTVLEVMYEAGFNSKSSFNTLFKKKTGFTPSEFKRQARGL